MVRQLGPKYSWFCKDMNNTKHIMKGFICKVLPQAKLREHFGFFSKNQLIEIAKPV